MKYIISSLRMLILALASCISKPDKSEFRIRSENELGAKESAIDTFEIREANRNSVEYTFASNYLLNDSWIFLDKNENIIIKK